MVVDIKLFSKQRIHILAHLRDNGKSRFSIIKRDLGIPSDGNLAWHLKVLQKGGYIKIDKVVPVLGLTAVNPGCRAECHINLTKKGIKSLDDFKKEITELIPA
jgi:predicted transcriptional regulator